VQHGGLAGGFMAGRNLTGRAVETPGAVIGKIKGLKSWDREVYEKNGIGDQAAMKKAQDITKDAVRGQYLIRIAQTTSHKDMQDAKEAARVKSLCDSVDSNMFADLQKYMSP